MSNYIDECDLERSHELERRLARDAEREPYAYRKPRRWPRYFSGLMFRAITAKKAVAPPPAMSYIRVHDAAQRCLFDDPAVATAEGRAGARRGDGSAQSESTRWPGVGRVLGEAA